MHLTEEDIQKLGAQYIERLKSARTQLPDGAMTITDMQQWMIKNNIENPEMLKTLINKMGKGTGAGKKNMS